MIPPVVMTFSVSDPSGGSGIQADVLTLASLGCHPLSVITGITVQDTRGLDNILIIDSDWVSDQARMLLEDIPVAAFKIGLLGNIENLVAVAEIISDYPEIPVVFDPTWPSGSDLMREEMIDAIKDILLPNVTVLILSRREAFRFEEVFLEDDEDEPQITQCTSRLCQRGVEFVLVSDTQQTGPDVCNRLYQQKGELRQDTWPRLAASFLGAGDTLSAAITGMIAGGLHPSEAVREAQEYTWQALKNGFRLGMGKYLPDRLFWANGDPDQAEDDENEN